MTIPGPEISAGELLGPLHVTRAAAVVLDAGGVVVGWSPSAERLLGYPPEEVLGRPAASLVARKAGTQPAPWMHTVGDPGSIRSAALNLRHRDGRILRMATTMCAVAHGPDGPAVVLLAADLEELRSWEAHQAMLRGLVTQSPVWLTIYDTELRVVWANAVVDREMGGPLTPYVGRTVDELFPQGRILTEHHPPTLAGTMLQVLEDGVPVIDLHYLGRVPVAPEYERVWSCSYYRLLDARGEPIGVCEEAVDITERHRAEQRLALLVRAGSTIGTSLDVVRTAAELVEVVVPRFADAVTVDLLPEVLEGMEPSDQGGPRQGLLRVCGGRGAQNTARSAGGTSVAAGEPVEYAFASPQARCLASGRSIVENAPGTPAGHSGTGVHARLFVPLKARGTVMGLVTFLRSRTAVPFDADEHELADELAARTAVCIDNARRYAREYAAAVTLQRSLLPQRLPPQSAVEATYRYLPADRQVGVGGDWFDVIPLSGTRVGLVVGDVVGHGLRAAATMGRLRTTVRALAQLDLDPDELLTRLAGVAGRGDRDSPDDGVGAEDDEIIGVTCLYAVYDPISRRCSWCSAGHPMPAVVDPATGRVCIAELPSGPPLGLGGATYENAEVELAPGSVLALFTNGLVDSRTGGADVGLHRLVQVLAQHRLPLEKLCDRAMAVLPVGPVNDDAALLLVRTRVLDARQVACWTLPADPSVVAHARTVAAAQLDEWGLPELAFTTELVVSELVTNAIRYASGPVRLRLIRDRALLCEVSDSGHTSPHLRHAAGDEEGGRGLFLVAQTTQRWGTRYTSDGKTIWAEQSLSQAASPQHAAA
ncbi:SpoIIE family protein phosphatase [Streptomyces nodosus]|uniref:SpoIIE family protein phosphatase n=1 Tax=Streptomyces nodosus TaxID=40318 RepID=UPI00380D59DE